MNPWVHPQERRSRIYFSAQIFVPVIAMIVIPIILLQDPAQDHVLISAAVLVIGAVVIFLGIRVLKNLRHEYRYEDDRGKRPNVIRAQLSAVYRICPLRVPSEGGQLLLLIRFGVSKPLCLETKGL